VNVLTTREIAIAAWVLVASIWLLSKRTIRRSLIDVARAVLALKILAWFGVLLLYNSGVILALWAVGVWSPVLLKDTVLWFFFVGIALGFRSATTAQDARLFSSVLKDSVKIVLVMEFLANTYTLPLIGELLLIPFVALLAMVDAVAHADSKTSQAAKLTTPLLAAAGLAVIGFSISKAIADFGTLWSVDSLTRLLLPPGLSILLIPFVCAVALYTSYEQLFTRLRVGLDVGGPVERYARRRILSSCRLNLGKTKACLKENGQTLMLIRSREDVNSLFGETTRS